MRAFFLLTGLGHEAVIAFFVLSGVLIAGRLVARPPQSAADYGGYLLDRLTRIWIVALPALLFSLVVAQACRRLLGAFAGSGGADCAPAAADLLANLLFLNKVFVPTLCSNGPYWSIQNEVWYYLALPADAPGVARARGLAAGSRPGPARGGARRSAAARALRPLTARSPTSRSGSRAGWSRPAGAAACRRRSAPWCCSAPGGGARRERVAFLLRDYLVGLALLALLLALRDSRLPAWWQAPSLVVLGRRLAGFSYSLYLTHAPVIYLIRTVLEEVCGVALPVRALTPAALAIMLLECLAALALAWLFHLAFERRTAALRTALRGRLGRRRALAAPAAPEARSAAPAGVPQSRPVASPNISAISTPPIT